MKTDDKSNEIKAIPELLRPLDLKGTTVTIDAMGCQRKIATCIKDSGGDDLLSVKANQPALLSHTAFVPGPGWSSAEPSLTVVGGVLG